MNNSFSRSAYQEGSTTSVSIQVAWWTRIVIIDMQKFYDLYTTYFFCLVGYLILSQYRILSGRLKKMKKRSLN